MVEVGAEEPGFLGDQELEEALQFLAGSHCPSPVVTTEIQKENEVDSIGGRQQEYDGQWLRSNQPGSLMVIGGGVVCAGDGSSSKRAIVAGPNAFYVMEGARRLDAALLPSGELRWSNGEVWFSVEDLQGNWQLRGSEQTRARVIGGEVFVGQVARQALSMIGPGRFVLRDGARETKGALVHREIHWDDGSVWVREHAFRSMASLGQVGAGTVSNRPSEAVTRQVRVDRASSPKTTRASHSGGSAGLSRACEPEGDAEFARRLAELDEEAAAGFAEDEELARRIAELEQEARAASIGSSMAAAVGGGLAPVAADPWGSEVDDLLLALRLQAEEEEKGPRVAPAGGPRPLAAGAGAPAVARGQGAGAAPPLVAQLAAPQPQPRGRCGQGTAELGLAAATRWDGEVDDLLLALELTAGDATNLSEAAGPPLPPYGPGVATR